MHSFREDVNGSQEAPDSFTPAHVELIWDKNLGPKKSVPDLGILQIANKMKIP